MLHPLRRHARLGGACAVAMALGASLAGHGTHVKTIFNVRETAAPVSPRWDLSTSKANASTRGGATTGGNTLYLMDPPLNHTGNLDSLGFRVVLQDEDGATFDGSLSMQFVSYAANGVDPDTGPLGAFKTSIVFPFFGSQAGRQAMEFEFTFGIPLTMPERHGVAIVLPAAPSWPNDGLSVHAQLNLANDPLRSRVPAPHDQQVWAFEAPPPGRTATPLGGRVLDTLMMGTIWALDPTLQTFVESTAYGTKEELYGPESLHPVAARGDRLGFFVQASNDGSAGNAFVFGSPSLLATPLPFGPAAGNSPNIWLDVTSPFPICLAQGVTDPATSQLRLAPLDFAIFPVGARDFWFQALLFYPATGEIQLTDATGVQGL